MQIISFCASHLRSNEQLDLLVRLLKSVQAQTMPVSMHLSVSFSPSCNLTDLFNIEMGAFTDFLHIYPQKDQMQQFEHYQYLANLHVLKNPLIHVDDAYILFTDDDDEWPPYRVKVYHDAIMQTPTYQFVSRINEYVTYCISLTLLRILFTTFLEHMQHSRVIFLSGTYYRMIGRGK